MHNERKRHLRQHSSTVTLSTMPLSQKTAVVGIDLGTTFSCIAVEKAGRINVVANKDGNRLLASAVFFDSTRVIGNFAMQNVHEYPARTVYNVKQLIGRQMTEPLVQTFIKSVGYNVANMAGEPTIRVRCNGKEEDFRPEQISAMILGELKESAERLLGQQVAKAVITVPAAFNEVQRLATKHAGMIAGFEVLSVINEPTAAALAWACENRQHAFDGKQKSILIFDMGGGTTDVSIISVSSKEIRVTSTNGDTALGGNHIDKALVDHFVEEIKKEHERDISQNKRALMHLSKACTSIKHQLSTLPQVSILLDNLIIGVSITLSLTRARFENIIEDIRTKTINLVRATLKMESEIIKTGSNTKATDISDIVLVGGSSKMPWVKKFFEDSIPGDKPVHLTVNCDEAVANGAGLYAAKLAGSNDLMPDIRLLDIAPLSYGIEVKGGVLSELIRRNTSLPASHTRSYTTTVDMQKSVRIQVYEGSSKLAKEARQLREFDLPVRPAAKGVPDIRVTFSLSQDFLLTVTAEDLTIRGEKKWIMVNALKAQSSEALDRMKQIQKTLQNDDQAEAKRRDLLDRLERLAYKKKAKDVISWIEDNRDAAMDTLTCEFQRLEKRE